MYRFVAEDSAAGAGSYPEQASGIVVTSGQGCHQLVKDLQESSWHVQPLRNLQRTKESLKQLKHARKTWALYSYI